VGEGRGKRREGKKVIRSPLFFKVSPPIFTIKVQCATGIFREGGKEGDSSQERRKGGKIIDS